MIWGLFNVKAQAYTADFNSTSPSGCSPLSVSFSTLSDTASGLKFFWEFGNGETSNEPNPSVLFTRPGKYSVKLIMNYGNQCDTIIKVNYITVFKSPEPDFTILSENWGCVPYKVDFQNNSMPGDTNIFIYHWDFGDGIVSNLENPSHVFSFEAAYTIALYVKDRNNCDNFIVYENLIQAYRPVANFSLKDSISCNGVLETQFTNKSTGTGNLSYHWDFGDGTVSDQKDVLKKYTNSGVYDVRLVCYDSFNCSDTLELKGHISVEKLIVDFSTNKDTFCQNEKVVFKNLSSKNTGSFWDFGDGNSSTAINPVHTYSIHGTHTVKLTIKAVNGCMEYFSKDIHIEKAEADFTSSHNFACSEEVTVQYTDKSLNAISWDWRFGNGTKSNMQNPVVSYTSEGVFVDTLIVKSKHGCASMKVVNPGLTIIRPRASFSPNNFVDVNSLKGCVPLTVNFKDKSVYNTPADSIIKWEWDFGDGTFSASKNPSHTFSGPAVFQVDLLITTARGCQSAYSATARTGTRQKADFYIEGQNVICASTPVVFTDKSEDKDLINEWYWQFGDGATSRLQNPKHTFVDTGFMEVKLLAYYNGCPDDEVKKELFYVKGPIVKPDYTTACDKRLMASFKGNFNSVEKFYWDFGDGSALDSVQPNPNHQYGASGNYKVKLRAINTTSRCSYLAEKDVVIRNPKAIIDLNQQAGCPGTGFRFSSGGSSDVSAFKHKEKTAKYLWDFGDGNGSFISVDTIWHQYKTKGTYNVKLKVRDFRGCEDSIISQIKIYHPAPNFATADISGCMPLRVEFENNTVHDTILRIFQWNFGDNSISNDANPVHTYTKHGLYNVSLTVTDVLGCRATLTKNGYMKALRPIPNFVADNPKACVGDTIYFKSIVTDSITSLNWNFGDGTYSSSSMPYHVYSNSGSYPVSLYVKDTKGCDSTTIKVNFIDIQSPPIVDFEADETVTSCYPLITRFSDKSTGSNISNWEWNFGHNNSKSFVQNPVYSYTKPGIYDVSLKATTSNGCASSLVKSSLLTVKGPWVKIVAPEKACKNMPIEFVASEKIDVHDMQWFFGDGKVGRGDTVFHTYKNHGFFTPGILLMNDNNQTCNKYITDTLIIDMLKASIYEYENGQTGCVPFQKNFNDFSEGATKWTWKFGDGSISEFQNPTNTFLKPGRFDTELVVSNDLGCKDSTLSTIHVFPLPEIETNRDTLICLGKSLNILATGAKHYSWAPDVYLNSGQIPNPISTPKENVEYQVMGIDSNGCVNYANLKVSVQQIPVIKIKDTTIVIGELVNLNAYSPDLYNYQWMPSYNLDYTNRPQVVAQPLETTTYTVTVSDTNNCFTVSKDILIRVRKVYTVDVPAAFTPNGDGVNDIILVKGWGIKELIEFRIYNRFGQLVFVSHDKNIGWDGVFKGNNQNIETYTYNVKVKTFEDEIMFKTGTIKILK
jgi:gliding motility-associated-like protein